MLSILSLQKHLWEHGFISVICSQHIFFPSAGCVGHAAGAHNSSGMALLLGWAAGSKFSLGSVRDLHLWQLMLILPSQAGLLPIHYSVMQQQFGGAQMFCLHRLK